MFFPILFPGMKQRSQIVIDLRSQICSFVLIAPMAAESQVCWIIRPAMLSGNDVFNVKPNIRQLVLVEVAVFTTMTGSNLHQVS